ncbi:WYL domain-containing protein [Tenuifilaceae bacterium CYCD]|nr:WYL domain-containing protein [Tenuifilaceae bacterium CYCD]
MAKGSSLLRYYLIIYAIRNLKKTNSTEIIYYLRDQSEYRQIGELKISKRTLRRDLSDIKSFFGIDIEYSRKEGRYIVSNFEDRETYIDEIMTNFEILNSIEAHQGKYPEYIIPENRKPRGNQYFVLISKAIKECKRVTFNYKKYYPEVSETRTVEPYALKQSRERWYILGFEKEDSTEKSFGLDRIEDLKITEERFEKKEVNWNAKYHDVFAMFTDGEKAEDVVLSFDHRDGNYIEAMPIHHSQKLTREQDRTIVKLHIQITLDLIMELMSRSWSIEVIEPQSLREKLHNIYKGAMERNS